MTQQSKNYIQSSIDKLEQPNNDHHLAFIMEGEMRFFDNDDYSLNWADRLLYFEEIDLKQNSLAEAVYYYGRWKNESVYANIEKAMDLFTEAEYHAIENIWYWILTTSTRYQKTLFYQFNKKDQLEALGERISNYIIERNESFPTRVIMDFSNQAIDLLDFLKSDQIKKIANVITTYAKNESLNYSFRYGFFNAHIAIKKHEKEEVEVVKLHRDVLSLKILEAELKGSTSKLILSGLLEQALAYCVAHVGDRSIIEDLKKRIDSIDYTDELAVIEIPEELKRDLYEAFKKYDEHVKLSIKIYINRIAEKHPFQILYGVLNDESIFRMDVENTKNFSKKLLKKSIASNFSTTVDFSYKRVKINSEEEKLQAKLHENLMHYLQETLNTVYYISSEIEDRCLVSIQSIYHFLNNCSIIDENDHAMIIWGIIRHTNGDYLSSISILMPKIESTLFKYLKKIGADVTSYDSRAISQRTLGGLLELDDVQKQFSIDFQYCLKLFLTADDGINFRNRLSHGSTSIHEYHRKTSLLTIFFLLKLYAKTFKIPEEG